MSSQPFRALVSVMISVIELLPYNERSREEILGLIDNLPLPEKQFLINLNVGLQQFTLLACAFCIFNSFRSVGQAPNFSPADKQNNGKMLDHFVDHFLCALGWKGVENVLRAWRETNFVPSGPTKTIFDMLEDLSRDWLRDKEGDRFLPHAQLYNQFKINKDLPSSVFVSSNVKPYFLTKVMCKFSRPRVYVEEDYAYLNLIQLAGFDVRVLIKRESNLAPRTYVKLNDATVHRMNGPTTHMLVESDERYSVREIEGENYMEQFVDKLYKEYIVDIGMTFVKPSFAISKELFWMIADGNVHNTINS